VHLAAVVIQIASTVVFARVLLVIGVVSPVLLVAAARPLLIMMTLMALLSLGVWFWGQKEQNRMPVQDNPSELKGALFFGVIFAVVLLAAAAAKERFGQSGLYVVAALSGLTDMDAITLSSAQLVNSDRLLPEVGWKLISGLRSGKSGFQGRRNTGAGSPTAPGEGRNAVRASAGRRIPVALGGLVNR
jgi:uncharacterized membrane protein (DUF4010 family)